MSTREDAECRYAQIEGERDYYKRRAERMEYMNARLRAAMRSARLYAGEHLEAKAGLGIVHMLEKALKEAS